MRDKEKVEWSEWKRERGGGGGGEGCSGNEPLNYALTTLSIFTITEIS